MRRRLADARGYTLVELLIAMSMFAVVLAAVMTLFDVASNDAYNEQERNISLLQQSAGVDRMARELREAYQVIGPTSATSSSYMDFLARVVSGGTQTDEHIIYDCSQPDPTTTGLKECVRYVSSNLTSTGAGTPPTGATSSVVVSRLLNGSSSDPNDPVFQSLSTPSSSGTRPTYGQIVIRTPSKGTRTQSNYTHQVVLNESFYMRQLDYGR